MASQMRKTTNLGRCRHISSQPRSLTNTGQRVVSYPQTDTNERISSACLASEAQGTSVAIAMSPQCALLNQNRLANPPMVIVHYLWVHETKDGVCASRRSVPLPNTIHQRAVKCVPMPWPSGERIGHARLHGLAVSSCQGAKSSQRETQQSNTVPAKPHKQLYWHCCRQALLDLC